MPHCSNPDHLYVTVDILILTEAEGKLNLLLSQRTHAPCQHQWALPGQFISISESAEDTVARLLEEMLPLPSYYSEQLYTFTLPGRDPRGRILSIAHLVIVPWKTLQPVLQQEGVPLKCFTIDSEGENILLRDEAGQPLAMDSLAFDHASIIRTGITRMQGKIEYTDIGFRFLHDPSAFSLSELQRIFEAVLGKTLDASNFRRFVRNRYEETGKIQTSDITQKKNKGRPAVLYKWHH